MRLIIHTRQGSTAGGLRRYNGSGLFSSIGRKLFSSGMKKVINAASKANLSQKIANVVVNGAQSAGEKLGKVAGEKLGKVVGEKLAKFTTGEKKLGKVAGEKVGKIGEEKLRGVKRKAAPPSLLPPLPKHARVNINHLIDGSGIVFD